jgi:hypothetical protein
LFFFSFAALVWCLERRKNQLFNRSASANRPESSSNYRKRNSFSLNFHFRIYNFRFTYSSMSLNSQHQSCSSSLLTMMTNSTLSLIQLDKIIKDNSFISSFVHDFHSIELCFRYNPMSVSISKIGFVQAFVHLGFEHHLLSRHFISIIFS